MGVSQLTICTSCARLKREKMLSGVIAESPPVSCTAYPISIPPSIQNGWEDHRTIRGDEVDGLIFEQAEGPYAALVLEAWEKVASKIPYAEGKEEADGVQLRGEDRGDGESESAGSGGGEKVPGGSA